jgi:hypothetical protein
MVWLSAKSPGAEIRFVNTLGEPVYLWFWPELKKQWVRPAVYLPRQGAQTVAFETPGKRYLVLRDQAQRDTHLGWVDVHRIAPQLPRGELLLDVLYVYETRVRTSVVCKSVPHTRFRRDGTVETIWRRVCEQREESYKVARPTDVRLMVRVGTGKQTLDDFLATRAKER